jgi:hypothetical protein
VACEDSTYSGDPANNATDRVRFEIGDTNMSAALLTDAEIAFLLAEYPAVMIAAANGAEQIAARYAGKVDSKSGGVSKSSSQLATHYRTLADDLRGRAAINSPALPYVGGLSKQEKVDDANATDMPDPAFAVGQFDNVERVRYKRSDLYDEET